ncbi:MAG: hypothetical protein ACKOFP_14460, partial [Actinomycetota bacterium]
GPDGLRVIRGAIDTAAILLRAGGQVVIEHSDEQGESAGEGGVPRVLRMDSRWRDVTDHLDLARRPRFTTATRAVCRDIADRCRHAAIVRAQSRHHRGERCNPPR